MSSASFPPVPRCYEGPGQDVRPSLSGARSQDTRSAAFRCRSIVLAYSASDYQTAPSLAHAVTRRDPRTRQFTANARRAAAENSGFEYRLTPTPDGDVEQSLACSPVKWGSGGAGAWNESASLALEVLPRLTPGAFLVSFCAHKKKLAVRRNLTAPEASHGPHRMQGPQSLPPSQARPS